MHSQDVWSRISEFGRIEAAFVPNEQLFACAKDGTPGLIPRDKLISIERVVPLDTYAITVFAVSRLKIPRDKLISIELVVPLDTYAITYWCAAERLRRFRGLKMCK